MNADRRHYGKLIKDLENGYTASRKKLLEDLQSAYARLVNYEFDFKYYTAENEQTSSRLTYVNAQLQGGRGCGGRNRGGKGDGRGNGGDGCGYYQDQRRSEKEQKNAEAD